MSRTAFTYLLLPAVYSILLCLVASPSLADELPTTAVPALRVVDLLKLMEDSQGFFSDVPDASLLGTRKITAFEENPHFVYVAGDSDAVRRRLLLLKPDTFIIEVRRASSEAVRVFEWLLPANAEAQVERGVFHLPCSQGTLVGRLILPADAGYSEVPTNATAGGQSDARLRVELAKAYPENRLLQVLRFTPSDTEARAPQAEMVQDRGRRFLTVVGKDVTARLSLPAEPDAAGTIALSTGDDPSLQPERLLPAGILPHGESGVALIRRWDSPYQGGRRPGWDTGQVAPELRRLVESQPTRRGRAIVLGCGTGTNAIYLAEQGFDVIGVDVAATALARAQDKARTAGVSVRWVLADVLALPDVEPVDLVFDRGCYHHVRQYDARGYVNSVLQISHPGTQLLLLAGNANDQRRGGPPKIKEAEIRGDFSEAFDFQWFREIRFVSSNSQRQGALAWSVLMRRK